VAADDPSSVLALNEVRQALQMLPDVQREALVMIGNGRFTYEKAAEIADVAVGTVKSRARAALQAILEAGTFRATARLLTTRWRLSWLRCLDVDPLRAVQVTTGG